MHCDHCRSYDIPACNFSEKKWRYGIELVWHTISLPYKVLLERNANMYWRILHKFLKDSNAELCRLSYSHLRSWSRHCGLGPES